MVLLFKCSFSIYKRVVYRFSSFHIKSSLSPLSTCRLVVNDFNLTIMIDRQPFLLRCSFHPMLRGWVHTPLGWFGATAKAVLSICHDSRLKKISYSGFRLVSDSSPQVDEP